jgi:hypothetical protein
MVLRNHFKRNFLAASISCVVLTSAPHAQTTAPASDANKATAPYRSAFDGYRAYTDEAVANWKAANDTTARIGGWREYARQAQADKIIPTRPAASAAKPVLKAAP